MAVFIRIQYPTIACSPMQQNSAKDLADTQRTGPGNFKALELSHAGLHRLVSMGHTMRDLEAWQRLPGHGTAPYQSGALNLFLHEL